MLQDSLANEQNLRKAMATEFGHKEEQLKFEQEKQKIAHEAELSQQALVRNSLIGGFAFTIVLVIVVYRSYQAKKRDNLLLEEQQKQIATSNKELNQVNEELQQQQEELVVLNDSLALQKQTIENTYLALKSTSEQLDKSI